MYLKGNDSKRMGKRGEEREEMREKERKTENETWIDRKIYEE
jgi:hypothetical protein